MSSPKPNPGQIAAGFDIDLERPRRRSHPAFDALRDRIAEIVTATSTTDRLAS